jgi:CHAT domain-containing protein
MLSDVHNVTAQAVEPSPAALLDTLHQGAFDVLHLSCHGQASHDDIDQSELIIADRPGAAPNTADPVVVTARTVRSEAELEERGPLVFLNACESGRLAPSLTAWGGWPLTFWERGAGAFVGTSWPVRENPAGAFAQGFYEKLLDGGTLAQAAGAARQRAKALGDSSWLAYKVYGQPSTTMS